MRSAPAKLMNSVVPESASPIDIASGERAVLAVLPLDRGGRLLRRPAYRFGDFALIPELYEVRARDERVAIAPKVFDFILCLIENRDSVVTHAGLRAAVWPGVAVSEASLTYAAMAARRALGDTGGTQSIIRTVRGRGYRFVAVLKDAVGDPLRDAFAF